MVTPRFLAICQMTLARGELIPASIFESALGVMPHDFARSCWEIFRSQRKLRIFLPSCITGLLGERLFRLHVFVLTFRLDVLPLDVLRLDVLRLDVASRRFSSQRFHLDVTSRRFSSRGFVSRFRLEVAESHLPLLF